jgi:hypothetical protein
VLGDRPLNPISPLGFAAATVGAFCLLMVYRVARAVMSRRETHAQQSAAVAPTCDSAAAGKDAR